MIAKLRSNFRLCKILVSVAFLLTFMFARWQSGLSAMLIVESMLGVSLGASKIWYGLASELLIGVIWMFLLPVLVNWFLNISRIYNLPRAEYCLLVQIFFALGYLICGCLNIVNFFTPVMLVWGSVLFPFVSSLVAAVLFYKVTAKLYFNDVTVVPYFRSFVIVYLILLIILEVL